jgi:hypothetical protein
MLSFIQQIFAWIGRQSIIWVTTTLLAILTLFSQTIVDRVKTGLNIADLRAKYYEKMAGDFSTLGFDAQSIIDDYSEAVEPGQGKQIGPKFLDMLVTGYNNALDTVRKNEYIYRLWINTYYRTRWLFFRTNALERYDTLLSSIYRLDDAIHSMNRVAVKIRPFVKNDSTYILSQEDSIFLRDHMHAIDSTWLDNKAKMTALIDGLE